MIRVSADKEQVHEPFDVNKKQQAIFQYLECFTWKRVFVVLFFNVDGGGGFDASAVAVADGIFFPSSFILVIFCCLRKLFFSYSRMCGCHTKYMCFVMPFFRMLFTGYVICVLFFFSCAFFVYFTHGIVFHSGHQFVCKS